MEVIFFFMVSDVVPCFGFRRKAMLMGTVDFSCHTYSSHQYSVVLTSHLVILISTKTEASITSLIALAFTSQQLTRLIESFVPFCLVLDVSKLMNGCLKKKH